MDKMTIRISTAPSRTSAKWRAAETAWEELVTRCSTPKDTGETPEQWAAMTRDERGRVKDVGGFVGGLLRDGTRRRGHCILRSLITLDIDSPDRSPDELWDWLSGTVLDGTAMLMYSTHSHTPDSPRLRLVIPLAHDVARDAYEPLARKVAAEAGIDCFDPTTFDPERLFYWPSHSTGAEFVFRHSGGGPLDPDRWLALYSDPSDPMEWPRAEGEAPAAVVRQAAGTGHPASPLDKRGIVGAFCRAYPVHLAIDTFLPHVYAPTDRKDRYTYRLGESTGGLVIYDGLWAWSFHSTDPARGRLLNSFDLVRIHRFGDLDAGRPDTGDPSALPSHQAMSALCSDRREVRRELVPMDLGDIDPDGAGEGEKGAADGPDAWKSLLDCTKRGIPAQTIKNAVTVLENDPALKGRIYHNLLTGRTETTGGLPWRDTGGQWRDDDDANLRAWMEREHGISGKDRLFDAVVAVSTAHPRHPIREWLDSLKWDGVPRVERLIIDRLGADDTPANREMTRNQLAAAVMRVYEPGGKHDHMLVLAGPEGVGKSTLLRTLGGEWYTDSVTTAEGKESMDQLQGVWIVEHSELSATKRADVETLKSYITRQNDRYRAPYGRRVTDHPRQCVFFGTTNETNFLKGGTGNRRFWVIPVNGGGAGLDGLAAERGQIWAEAKSLYDGGLRGAALELSPECEMEARARQRAYNDMADDPLWGQIDDFLEMPLPYQWDMWDERRRYSYVHDPEQRDDTRYSGRRNVVCAMEIMHEVLGLRQSEPYTARKINAYLEGLPNWRKGNPMSRHAAKLYGRQRSFERILTDDEGEILTNEKYNEDDDL